MRLTFHNHTEYSRDCRIPIATLEDICIKRGIEAIVITDHNEIKGAKQAVSLFRTVRVIVGEEIMTTEGEIVGIFLSQRIEPGLSLEKTIEEIHQQGGLVVVVHPFDRLRKHIVSGAVLSKYLKGIDIVEYFNARTVFSNDNKKARVFAQLYNKPIIAGNDAHTLGEIGLSVMDMPAFAGAQDFLMNVKQAVFVCRKAPLWVHIVTAFVKYFQSY